MKNTFKVVALFFVAILAMLVIPSSSKATDIPPYTAIKISVVVIGEDRTIEYEATAGTNLRKLGHGTIFGLNNQEFAEQYDGYYLDEACTEKMDLDEYFTDGLTLYVKALTTDDEQGTETEQPTTGDEQETEPTTDGEQGAETEPTTDSEQGTETEQTSDEQTTETQTADAEKDSTPKTGIVSYSGIAAVIAVVALTSIVVIKKRNA